MNYWTVQWFNNLITERRVFMDLLLNHLHPDDREAFKKYTGKRRLAWFNYLLQKRAREERIRTVGLDPTPEERARAKRISQIDLSKDWLVRHPHVPSGSVRPLSCNNLMKKLKMKEFSIELISSTAPGLSWHFKMETRILKEKIEIWFTPDSQDYEFEKIATVPVTSIFWHFACVIKRGNRVWWKFFQSN